MTEWRVTRFGGTLTGWYKGCQFFVLAPTTYYKGYDGPKFTLYVLLPGFKKEFRLNTVKRGKLKAERVVTKFREKFKMAWVEWEYDGSYGVNARGKVRGVQIFTIIFNSSRCYELRCNLPGIKNCFGGDNEKIETKYLEKKAEEIWIFFRNKMFKL